MAKCINCAAPLPSNSIECEYCGSRNDTDLKGVHDFTTEEPDSCRICPNCNVTLQTIDLKIDGKFLIERCEHCFGLFFDTGELEALLDTSVKNVYTINLKKLDNINLVMTPRAFKVVYIKCPVCSNFMNRVNFGTKSGVIVDVCKDHGIWLNAGELRHLLEWKKAGGKLLHEQRESEKRDMEKKEQEKRERERAGYLDTTDLSYYYSTEGSHSHSRKYDIDIIDLVKGVVSRLF
ncbi:MAG: zf-TFIIB domain-containing protein [Desulfamplus sp.]|nr:zf-TFIIB domain-containing protein [Desulfamplus sp.]MBF0411418.1 zf-TFIIB domain-containing protein [Desulfamplus sp.]